MKVVTSVSNVDTENYSDHEAPAFKAVSYALSVAVVFTDYD